MKILHYSLGFPPYRTGGLTKFCMDLMLQQLKDGHEVALLWPGEMQIVGTRTKIRQRNAVQGIKSLEVINPLPVSYDEGIKDFQNFMEPGDKKAYDAFLKEYQPDVIHFHSLMGLHKSFLEAAKEQEIRMVFTTHDFFPICPKVTMFRHGQVCASRESCDECGICNSSALSIKKIQILQSPLYRNLKDTTLVKKIRKQHRDDYLGDNAIESSESVGTAEDFKSLRRYYGSLLQFMDEIHYNSSVTRAVYEKVFCLNNGSLISISHSNIVDHRRIKTFNSELIRIRYLGPQSAAKGYYFLIDVLNEVWKTKQNFRLDVHFTPKNIPPYIRCHKRYGHDQLKEIFDDTDVLICPSIWYETFGYTVIEALSYGVPVIISDHVGAKDIVKDGCGIVYEHSSRQELAEIITNLQTEILQKMNNAIRNHQSVKTLDQLSKEIYILYCKM